MPLHELLNQLTSLGVMAVEVSSLDLETVDISIDEKSLPTAVSALQILGPVVGFYEQRFVTEDWFMHAHKPFHVPVEVELPAGLLEKHYKPQVDLRTLNPALKAMKNKFKDPLFVELLLVSGVVKMSLTLEAEWNERFSAAFAEAEALADSQHQEREMLFDSVVETLQESIKAQQRREQQALEAPHLEALQSLLQDPGFVKLASVKATTQKALLVYVRHSHKEALEALGENRCKEVLGDLALEVQVGKFRQGTQASITPDKEN